VLRFAAYVCVSAGDGGVGFSYGEKTAGTGYKTLTMTLRYSHLPPSHKVKAVDLLDSKLNKVCEK